jgi:hypothetical protein
MSTCARFRHTVTPGAITMTDTKGPLQSAHGPSCRPSSQIALSTTLSNFLNMSDDDVACSVKWISHAVREVMR